MVLVEVLKLGKKFSYRKLKFFVGRWMHCLFFLEISVQKDVVF